MMKSKQVAFVSVILLMSCVDRIDFETTDDEYPVVVTGFISDQPGPYEVHVSRSFDVQARSTTPKSISAKKVTIFDDTGYAEVLQERDLGVYTTNVNGIRGKVGRKYSVRVELLDGKIYEST